LKHTQRIIIDGYNVIYTDDQLRRTACKDLQGARERLLERLEGYLSGRHMQITVVFDGRGGIVEAESVIPGRLQVVFSAGSQTADELIVGMLCSSGNPRQFIVVTSDRAGIAGPASDLGCEVIGSKRFLDRVARAAGPGTARTSGEHAGRSGLRFGDTDYWLEKFQEEGDDEDGA
jgi:predicted RNA-binding protein with PIN domain